MELKRDVHYIHTYFWRLYGSAVSELTVALVVLGTYASGILPSFGHIAPPTLYVLTLAALIAFVVRVLKQTLRPSLQSAPSRAQIAISFAVRFIGGLLHRTLERPRDADERTALLLVLVKSFFLPLMVQFAFENQALIGEKVRFLFKVPMYSGPWFVHGLFPLMISTILFIDVLYFILGYALESRKLNNVVKSVEPTLLGWIVVLMCYPPFNQGSGAVLGGYQRELMQSASSPNYVVGAFLGVVLFSIYVSASVSLGLKCSNLTSRGIVSRGPYRFVRHPAYASKVIAWWLSTIPIMSPVVFVSMLAWTLIYTMRAVTEERHLGHDPAYAVYRKKVPYRFIPGVI